MLVFCPVAASASCPNSNSCILPQTAGISTIRISKPITTRIHVSSAPGNCVMQGQLDMLRFYVNCCNLQSHPVNNIRRNSSRKVAYIPSTSLSPGSSQSLDQAFALSSPKSFDSVYFTSHDESFSSLGFLAQ